LALQIEGSAMTVTVEFFCMVFQRTSGMRTLHTQCRDRCRCRIANKGNGLFINSDHSRRPISKYLVHFTNAHRSLESASRAAKVRGGKGKDGRSTERRYNAGDPSAPVRSRFSSFVFLTHSIAIL